MNPSKVLGLRSLPAAPRTQHAPRPKGKAKKTSLPVIDDGQTDYPQSEIGPWQFHFPNDTRERLMVALGRFDPDSSKIFLRAVEGIITLRRRFDANKFPAMELRNIQRALSAAVNLIDKTTLTVRTHLDRACIEYNRGEINLSMALGHLHGYTHALDAYIRLRQPVHSPKGGRPAKENLHATIAVFAKAYQEILDGRPSAAPTGRFNNIVLLLLPFLGEKDTQDPRRLIAAAIRR